MPGGLGTATWRSGGKGLGKIGEGDQRNRGRQREKEKQGSLGGSDAWGNGKHNRKRED